MGEFSKLGRYELRRILGKGAMGVVYEGFDPSLNRGVAVKTILKSVVIDEETAASYSARFVREAKAAARLSHSNIVQVYDFGEQDDVAYLVMEFIQGRELRGAFDARERFDVADTVRIMGELLEALEFAHQAGVVHRDVKPANVMLDAQGRVKLADFGVARLQDGNDRSKGGTMVGTPAFMSPEQITGARVDRRTDVFSAGIVLYQLLTGEQPFKGEGAWTVAKQIMQDEPQRPSTLVERVPPAFDQIINRALAKKPDQRFASANEFAAALRGALSGGAAPRGSDAEIEFWRSIQGSSDPAEFAVYLKEFPQGVYAELARIKMSKLPAERAEADVAAGELAEEKARLEAALAAREAEYRKREAEAEARRAAEEKALAEADARREAEAKARAAAEEKARLEAIEQARKEAQAELAKKEVEYRRREAEAQAKADAEARARRDAEARARAEAESKARRQAEENARMRKEAEARAKAVAEEHARYEAEAARRAAEHAKHEEKLKRQLAAGPKAKLPLLPAAVTLAIILGAVGAWYWKTTSEEARVAALTAALDAATRANEELGKAKQAALDSQQRAADARAAEAAAQKSGDAAALKAATDARLKADADMAAQAKLLQQREADAKKADEAAKAADAKKQTETAKAAEKAAAEKVAAEKAAAEKAAAEKLAAEKAAADKANAEKAVAERLAAEKAAAEKAVASKSVARSAGASVPRLSLPKPGDRWIYNVSNTDRKDQAYEAALEVRSSNSGGVSYAFIPAGRSEANRLQRVGTHVSTSVAPSVILLSPYLLYYEKLQPGELRNFDSKASDCPATSTFPSCQYFPIVAGKERISVPAGSFDAWKIVVNANSGFGTILQKFRFTYWYDDSTGVLLKYESRMLGSTGGIAGGSAPDVDMELVATMHPASQPMASSNLVLPSVGDQWIYEVREVDGSQRKYAMTVDALAVSASQIREAIRPEIGNPMEMTHGATSLLTATVPGVASFWPYLRAFKQIRAGERLPDIEQRQLWQCTSTMTCTSTARVFGTEKVTVRAGSFDAWKIVVEIQLTTAFATRGNGTLTYWYSEQAKRIVKYQSRVRSPSGSVNWAQPDVDMELLSYTLAETK